MQECDWQTILLHTAGAGLSDQTRQWTVQAHKHGKPADLRALMWDIIPSPRQRPARAGVERGCHRRRWALYNLRCLKVKFNFICTHSFPLVPEPGRVGGWGPSLPGDCLFHGGHLWHTAGVSHFYMCPYLAHLEPGKVGGEAAVCLLGTAAWGSFAGRWGAKAVYLCGGQKQCVSRSLSVGAKVVCRSPCGGKSGPSLSLCGGKSGLSLSVVSPSVSVEANVVSLSGSKNGISPWGQKRSLCFCGGKRGLSHSLCGHRCQKLMGYNNLPYYIKKKKNVLLSDLLEITFLIVYCSCLWLQYK